MNNKQQFILALIFIITFSIISGFVFIYGAIKNVGIWEIYKPYFNMFLVPVGTIIGYYARMYKTGDTTITEKKSDD
jgi:hypothetical protein